MIIQAALEAYRGKFGDYPRIPDTLPDGVSNDEEYLLNALNGRFGPLGAVIDARGMLNNAPLSFERDALPLSGVVANRIVDPWGEPYLYDDTPMDGATALFGYHLYSSGSDMTPGTADDIYAR